MNEFLRSVGEIIITASMAVAGIFGFGGTPVQAPDLNVGATIPVNVAVFQTSLQASITSSATSMTLVSGTDKSGDSLSGYICFNIDEGTATEEFVCGTASGTAITSMIRGIDPVDGDLEVTALKKAHRRGASVKVTNYPSLAILARILNGNETLPNKISYTSHPTFSSNTELIDKKYADDLAIAGAADASTTVKGIVEEATSSEINAGTAAGGTSARLFVGPEALAASNYASFLPTTGQKDALVGTSGTVGSSNKYVTNDDTATAATANKVARRLAGGNITVVTESANNNSTNAASTAYVDAADATLTRVFANGVFSQNANSTTTTTIAHGLGKTPKIFKITGVGGGINGVFSQGSYNGTTNRSIHQWFDTNGSTSGNGSDTTSAIWISYAPSSGSGQTLYIKGVVTWDATNITITWTNGSTGNSSLTVYYTWEAEA